MEEMGGWVGWLVGLERCESCAVQQSVIIGTWLADGGEEVQGEAKDGGGRD